MNRRSAVAFALSAMLASSPVAWAQGPGNGNGNGPNAEGGPGNGNGMGEGNGPGNGNGPKDNVPGNGNGPGGGPVNGGSAGNANAGGSTPAGPAQQSNGAAGGAPAVTGQATAPAEQSESDVLAAVEAGRAVPLSTIMPDVRTRTGGEVINAQLQQVGSFLLYAVTVLTPEGKVSIEYYYARSGQHVEP
ncbi:MAG: hypothetical protein WBA73_20480 [Devosia sp.]